MLSQENITMVIQSLAQSINDTVSSPVDHTRENLNDTASILTIIADLVKDQTIVDDTVHVVEEGTPHSQCDCVQLLIITFFVVVVVVIVQISEAATGGVDSLLQWDQAAIEAQASSTYVPSVEYPLPGYLGPLLAVCPHNYKRVILLCPWPPLLFLYPLQGHTVI